MSNPDDSSGLLSGEFAQAVEDFELSWLDSPSPSSSSSMVACVGRKLRRDSLVVPVSELEDRLGVHHVAVWNDLSTKAIAAVVRVFKDLDGPSVCARDFHIVRRLGGKRRGVLLRVSSVELKTRILDNKVLLSSCGLSVGLA